MASEPGCPQCDGVGQIPVAGNGHQLVPCPTCRKAETTVRYECETCWARADTPDRIEHQPITHPEDPAVRRYEFPILDTPSPGLFGAKGT